MSVARMAVAVVKYRDYIWVAGGMTGEKKKPVCKIVECYNSKTNEFVLLLAVKNYLLFVLQRDGAGGTTFKRL